MVLHRRADLLGERIEVVDGVHIHIELEGVLLLLLRGARFLFFASLLVATRLLDIANVGAVLDGTEDAIPVVFVGVHARDQAAQAELLRGVADEGLVLEFVGESHHILALLVWRQAIDAVEVHLVGVLEAVDLFLEPSELGVDLGWC